MPDFVTNPLFWLYLTGLAPYAIIVGSYGFRSPWYESGLGRALLLSYSVIAVLLVHALLIVTLGPGYPGSVYVRGFLVGGVIVAGWVQLLILLRLQRRDRQCPDSEESLP